MGRRGPQPHDPAEVGRARQEQQNQDRREAAGLPREKVEANDQPDDDPPGTR